MGWDKPIENAKKAISNTAQNIADRFSHQTPEAEDVAHLGIDDDFAHIFCTKIYKKVMLECVDRATIPNGIDKGGFNLTVYDSYSPYKQGLVSWIVYAMVSQRHLYLKKTLLSDVHRDLYVFNRATLDEAYDGETIKPNYIELDFTNFKEARLIKLLFELLSLVIVSLNKGIVVSQAVILKLHNLSEMIHNKQNLEPLIEQVKQLNDGIRKGRTSFIDAQSSVEHVEQSSEASSKTVDFVFGLIATLIGLPKSDLFAEVVTGLGNGDNGDSRRENATIRRYFYDVLSGVLYNVFNQPFEYRPIIEDINEMISAAAFIETTTIFSEQGKEKFLTNNFKGYNKEDFNLDTPVQTPPISNDEVSE